MLEGSRRFRLRLRWIAAGLLLLGGCTILQPVQISDGDRRFALKRTTTTTDTSGKAIPCWPTDLQGVDCQPLAQDFDKLYGDLAPAMWEADMRRRQLLGYAAQHTNINSAYNALLWPLGAYFITKKLRHPEWSTRDVAALAVGSYGFLSSGIPDRDKIYIQGAQRLACSLLIADAALYPTEEIKRAKDIDSPKPDDLSCFSKLPVSATTSLEDLIADLDLRIEVYRAARSRLPPTPSTRTTGSAASNQSDSQVDRRRRAAIQALNGPAPRAAIPVALDGDADKLLPAATLLLSQLIEQRDVLLDAGNTLRNERSFIDNAIAVALMARTPVLTPPQEAASAVQTALSGFAKAQGALIKVVPKVGASDKRTSAERQQCFVESDLMLQSSIEHGQRWLKRHALRVKRVSESAVTQGCPTQSLAKFAASLLPAEAASAPAAAASVSTLP